MDSRIAHESCRCHLRQVAYFDIFSPVLILCPEAKNLNLDSYKNLIRHGISPSTTRGIIQNDTAPEHEGSTPRCYTMSQVTWGEQSGYNVQSTLIRSWGYFTGYLRDDRTTF